MLSRLSTFLPQLSAANESLERELAEAGGNADARNIEHVSDGEDAYIEMVNLQPFLPIFLSADLFPFLIQRKTLRRA